MLLSKRKRRKAKTKAKKATQKKRAKKAAGKRVKKLAKRRVKRAKPRKRMIRKTRAAVVSKGKEIQIGAVTHYFPHVKAGAAVIENGTLALGDTIHIKGHTTDFKQKVRSLQINRVPINEAKPGDEIGILVKSRVRINDKVYKISR